MKTIHKIAAIIIKDNAMLMVRKKGKDIWTNVGGRPESGELEEETLLREVKEELHCKAEILRKLGDFEAKAAMDKAMVKLSTYLVKLKGEINLDDPELEEYKFISKNYKSEGIKLPLSIEKYIIPFCIKEGLLKW